MIKEYKDIKWKRKGKCYLCRKIIERIDLEGHESKLYCQKCHKIIQNQIPTIEEVKRQMKRTNFQMRFVYQKGMAKREIENDKNM